MPMLPLIALSVFAAAAHAAPSPEVQFVGNAARICLNTRADPATVMGLAAREGWTTIDPASTPDYPPRYIIDGRTFTRTHAWTLQRAGKTYWVGLFDVPDRPAIRDCAFMGWDVDFEGVNAIIRGKNPAPEGAA